ncbi:bacteriohemerythrin [Aminipila terrae]|uniref:Bacteriohemerythrin n=1 Tax=Aminipila terrae TaxID=2697030 RepID=A0A6P1MGV4_9FIRM|nr:bacteriohemerythrin [Aminipila terrae]QHI73282.1 bacteriohemerythrin [Aminipila terrae]
MSNIVLKSWNSSYSVGVSQLDFDHQKLLEMINQLHKAMSIGQSKVMIAQLISNLKNYTLTHFKNEESYLAQINHPTLNDQKKQHAAFTDKINEFESELEKGNITLAMQVMHFLNDWLLQHIMERDMQYAKN